MSAFFLIRGYCDPTLDCFSNLLLYISFKSSELLILTRPVHGRADA